MTSHILATAMLALLSVEAALQLPTVPDILQTEGSSTRVNMTPSGEMPPLDALLKQVDMVVRATVGESRSFLSDDQRDVYTEYRLTNIRPLYRPPLLHPAVMPEVAIAVRGGTITLNGRTFVQREEAFPPLQPGAEGVFLLVRRGQQYRLAGEGIGAFIVSDGRLRAYARVTGFAKELDGLPVDAAQAYLANRAQAARQR